MRKLIAVLATTLLFGVPLPAAADSGVAQGVKPEATATSGRDVRDLVVGSDVAIGETVTTGRAGLVQLLFNDSTRIVVGANSSLVIEDYLVRDDNSAGKFAINALSGTFRFVTGGAPKNRYEIRTPTGTIGVRGTSFDFSISKQRPDFVPPAPLSTYVLLFHGSVRICNLAGKCADVSDACDFGAFNAGGAINVDTTRPVRTSLRGLFPYASNQTPLLARFRIANAGPCLNPPPPPTDHDQQSDQPPKTYRDTY